MVHQISGDAFDAPLGLRYEIQDLLGKNAGRKTFLARDLVSENLVVVKLLSFDREFQWDDLKLFEREVETLKSLAHTKSGLPTPFILK